VVVSCGSVFFADAASAIPLVADIRHNKAIADDSMPLLMVFAVGLYFMDISPNNCGLVWIAPKAAMRGLLRK
jgi:hypothetical protein